MNLQDLSTRIERISTIYAEAFQIECNVTRFLLKPHEEVDEFTQAYLMMQGQARTKGMPPQEMEAAFRAEMADVLCHTLLLARFLHVDLEAAITEKWLSRETHSA